jgi:hypothetical protein
MFVADSKAQYCAPPTGYPGDCSTQLTPILLRTNGSPLPVPDDDSLHMYIVCPGDFQLRILKYSNSANSEAYYDQMQWTQITNCPGAATTPVTFLQQYEITPPADTNYVFSEISLSTPGDYFFRYSAYCYTFDEGLFQDSTFIWDLLIIRVLPGPTAYAGTDFYACTPQIPPFGPNPGYYWYINLNATDPSPNTGQWTYLSGTPTPAVLIANPNNHQDTAYLQSGIYSYEFLWTVVDSNGCWDADTLKVDHIQSSAVDIYPDTLSVCGPCFKFRPGPSGNYTMPGYDVVPLPSYNSSSDYGYFQFSEIGPMPDTLFHVTYLGGSVVEVCVDSVGLYAVQLEINNVCVHDSDVVVLNFLTTDTIPSLGYFSLGNCAGKDTLFVLIDPPNANQTLNIGTPLPTGVTSVYASAGMDTLFIVMNDLSIDYTINFSYNYNLYGGDTCDQAGVIAINNPQLASFVAHDFSLLCGTPFIEFMDSLVSGLTGQFTMAPSYQTLQPLAANEFNGAYGHFYPPNPGEYRFTITTHFDCYNQTDTFTVTVSGPPPFASAGTNIVVPCGESLFQLNGSTPFWGTGLWSEGYRPLGASVNIDFDDQALATFNLGDIFGVVTPGEYAFVWTLFPTDSTCGLQHYDSVFVYVPEPINDTAFAGIDTSICDTAGVFLNALANPNLGGHWQSHPDNPPGISFSHPDSNFTYVYGIPPTSVEATYWFIWNLNTNCTSPDTVALTFTPRCCFAEYHPAYQHWRNDTLIDQFTVLSGKYYVDGTVSVTSLMDITNVDMVFGECGQLVFLDSSMVRANNSVFRACAHDKTWKGITFDGALAAASVFESCMIKNAQRGLNFKGKNLYNIKIAGNQFIDCRVGVFVFQSAMEQALTGNTFTFNADLDSIYESGCDTAGLYGSFAGMVIHSHDGFPIQITQNHFVSASNTYSIGIGWPYYGIITDQSFLLASMNRFSNCASDLEAAFSGLEFSGNQSERNIFGADYGPSLRLFQMTEAVVKHNTFICNTTINPDLPNDYRAAIYVEGLETMVELESNQISGYHVGIIGMNAHTLYARENQLKDCVNYGIYTLNSRSYLSCNEVDLLLSEQFNLGTGIMLDFTSLDALDNINSTIVKSNCVFDAATGIHWKSSIPDTSVINSNTTNNYIYNYWDNGIRADAQKINTRQNTLISNHQGNNPAIDLAAVSGGAINSTADYGILNISAGVNLATANRLHSVASCGTQISEDNNNPQNENQVMSRNAGCYEFDAPNGVSNFNAAIGAYGITEEDLLNEPLRMLMLVSMNRNKALLEGVYAQINQSNLNGFEKARLHLVYLQAQDKTEEAHILLQGFIPESDEQSDWKNLQLALLSEESKGIRQLKPSSETGKQEKERANFTRTGKERPLWASLPRYVESDLAKTRKISSSELICTPNPSDGQVQISYEFPTGSGIQLRINDIHGRMLMSSSSPFSTGNLSIDLSDLPAGYYIVSAWNDENPAIHQQIIKK